MKFSNYSRYPHLALKRRLLRVKFCAILVLPPTKVKSGEELFYSKYVLSIRRMR